MEKPEKIKLKKCIVCHKEQIWESTMDCVITKDWHSITLHTGGENAQSHFYNDICLTFPVNDCVTHVCCTMCIPKAIELYTHSTSMGVWNN